MNVSIITPSVRDSGLELVEKALKRQTFKNFEWLIGSPTKPTIDIPHVWVKDRPKKKGDYWQIYTVYNDLVRKSKGELIISLQDYTYIKPDGIEKMWGHYQDEPKTIVTGVGNKYESDEWIVETWQDPRMRDDQGSFYGVFLNDIEINFASFAKKSFYEVGGFDQTLNAWSSACGLDVLTRLGIIGGWDFKIDQTNETYSIEHGRLDKWEEHNPFTNGIWDKKVEEYKRNPILNYLK